MNKFYNYRKRQLMFIYDKYMISGSLWDGNTWMSLKFEDDMSQIRRFCGRRR